MSKIIILAITKRPLKKSGHQNIEEDLPYSITMGNTTLYAKGSVSLETLLTRLKQDEGDV